MNFKNLKTEIALYLKQVFRPRNFWILLPGLISVGLVYISHYFQVADFILNKKFHEWLALGLVPAILLILATRSYITRDPLLIYLAVLALIFFIREMDDTDITIEGREYVVASKKLVDVLLVLFALWGVRRHERIFASLNRSLALKIGLFGVLWSYLFSQLIARRAFGDILPLEDLLHVPLEEAAETAAHLFFISFAFACVFLVPNRAAITEPEG